MSVGSLPVLHSEDLASDQEVRWCPGCGDFSVLAQVKKVLAGLGLPQENMVFVSGIGCASRLPYYLDLYGFHGIHGRAPSLATGIKLANPNLQVWVVTGDGDGLSIGAGQLVHALRRNVDIKILLFNNEVYGLTKGQFSPTTRTGTRTRSSPQGSLENPLRGLSLALGSEATFVARTLDVDVAHLGSTLRRAAAHRGTAFVEIYQNCKIFNDGVFDYATDKAVKADNALFLEHGQPLLFGKDRNQGIRLRGWKPEIVTLGNGVESEDLLIHDEREGDPSLAFLLSRLMFPEFPECFGVFRCVDRPTYETQIEDQDILARDRPYPTLDKLLSGDETWVVESL